MFHLRGWAEPAKEPLVVRATTTLHFEIENVAKAMAVGGPGDKLRYDVVCDPAHWDLSESDSGGDLGTGRGEISIPKPGGTVVVRAAVFPIATGLLPLPCLLLSALSTQGEWLPLSPAQVYNTTLGHVTGVMATAPTIV